VLHLDLASVGLVFDISKPFGSARSNAVGVVVSYVLVGFTLETLWDNGVDDLTVNGAPRVRFLGNEGEGVVEFTERRGGFHLFYHLTCFFVLVSLALRPVRLVEHGLGVEGQLLVHRI